MKKSIFLFFLLAFFTGCASTNSIVHLKTSEPLIITQKPEGKKVYIKFNNSINIENNITKSVEYMLQNNGYEISQDSNSSDYAIYGDLVDFKRIYVKDPNVYMGFGFGMSRFYGGFGHFYDYDNPYEYNDTSYIYEAQVSLLIKLKNLQDYSTNLNLQSDRGVYSTSTIMAKFADKISTQILHFLEF
ncbi:hypothetical protein CSPB12327_02925 [Campylobacter sp. RM12327]|uniref:hypothetical protein n=1 Tax=Campylobacter sputorum TaxID=206 RepID=UPI00053BDFE8|nr:MULTISPECIES: hypothetical protein [Campylobacter]ASM40512.1 hypothetical protein CSPB_1321 [Campylobacter sputorum]MBE7357823.1 hypothetical protein [Campylobacter sp. RM11302]MBF6669101.1 hypothetical protein [Campylobacter sp. RM12327]MBF6673890.1 hypothetical protein [Campylobacter sp. RM13538]MBF6675841.1 hypothetical protein [Campylobacter sp. RM12321]